MGQTLQVGNSLVVSAFKTMLFHQLLGVVLILALLSVAWNVLRSLQFRKALASGGTSDRPLTRRTDPRYPEPTARRLLRITFGLIWLFDGILQAQTQMPLGMTSGVLQPAASGSPSWVNHLVNIGVNIWTNHPVPAAASAVWIQVGIGLFLLAAPRGRWSQLAAGISVGWGLVVWGFGEAFGGIFAPGLTWAFGAPGAVVFYIAAGVLIALPEHVWRKPKLGRAILAGVGVFFVAMATLQAWPGRGFWQGQAHGAPTAGSLTSMVQQMTQTSQPGFFAASVRWFSSFDAAHGWGVNLILVIALLAIGVAFLWGKSLVVRWAVVGAVVLCLADWLFVEDLGFFGGVGTDPNSMIPMALVFVAGYLALTHVPAQVESNEPVAEDRLPSEASEPGDVTASGRTWWERLDPAYAFRVAAAIGSIAVVVLGAVPMAAAATNPNADPLLAEALDGIPTSTNAPAPDFHLVDQDGRPVSLTDLRGKTVALTFLDPVCTSDCPLIAQEFRLADGMLGTDSSDVEFVAVVANPIYRSTVYTRAFDTQEDMTGLRNWLYLTGSVAQLQQVWKTYGVLIGVEPAGAMVSHSELTYLIDATGHTRMIMSEDQGTGPADKSSFTVLLVDQVERVLHR